VSHCGESELTEGRQEGEEKHAAPGLIDVGDIQDAVKETAYHPHASERTRHHRIGFGDVSGEDSGSENGERLERVLVRSVGSSALAL